MRKVITIAASVIAGATAMSSFAATNSTTLQTSYSRVQSYRPIAPETVDTASARNESDECTARDCASKSYSTGGGGTKSTPPMRRSSGGRDEINVRPRWHKTLPGMLR